MTSAVAVALVGGLMIVAGLLILGVASLVARWSESAAGWIALFGMAAVLTGVFMPIVAIAGGTS